MDHYQAVVTEYLRADRAVFVNTECLLQLEPGEMPAKDTSWYCDAVAVDLREGKVYLCEITYAGSLSLLLRRLGAWRRHWSAVRVALMRDCAVRADWEVQPWVFLPRALIPQLRAKLLLAEDGASGEAMPYPLITALEEVVPWKYRSWNRREVALEQAEVRT